MKGRRKKGFPMMNDIKNLYLMMVDNTTSCGAVQCHNSEYKKENIENYLGDANILFN